MPDAPTTDSSPNALLALIGGHRTTAVVYVACRLELPDLLADGPKTVVDLAARTEAHAPSLRRLLRAMVTLGLCTAPDGDAFALTPLGRHLVSTTERSLRPWALFEGDALRRGWSGLVDSVRSGKTGGELAGHDAARRFETLAEMGVADLFNQGMVCLTRLIVPDVLAAYDFSGIGRLMDVGGGHGELLGAILDAYPSLRGVIYDLPHCADGARRHLAEAGVADRCDFVGGSFFESVPPGTDAIVMKSIIHDWDDEKSLVILRNCRRALGAGGRVLLVERIMPDAPKPMPGDRATALSDLNMLCGPGGRERTEREFRELLARGGFGMTRVVSTGQFYVIEAAPV